MIEDYLDEVEMIIHEFKKREPVIYNMYKETEMLSDEDIYEIIISESFDIIFKEIT